MSSKFERIIREMPRNAQITLKKLVDDIRLSGPAQPGYKKIQQAGQQHVSLSSCLSLGSVLEKGRGSVHRGGVLCW